MSYRRKRVVRCGGRRDDIEDGQKQSDPSETAHIGSQFRGRIRLVMDRFLPLVWLAICETTDTRRPLTAGRMHYTGESCFGPCWEECCDVWR